MKNSWKKWLTLGLSSAFIFSSVACGGDVVDVIDANKTQIYVAVYNGGTGVDWIKDLAKEWNKTNDKFEVVVNGKEKFNVETAIGEMQSGLSATSNTMFYCVTPAWNTAINQGLLEDLSDVLEMKPDGDSGKTVREKLGNDEISKEKWLNQQKDFYGNGCYALPYADSFSGFVFDYQRFAEAGWLIPAALSDKAAAENDGIVTAVDGNYLKVVSSSSSYYKTGDRLMRAGKDGKFGTYDDGQPITVEEWDTMINKIVVVSQRKAFMWTGQYSAYLDSMFWSVLSQIGGYNGMTAIQRADSNGEQILLSNGNSAVITPQNGYLAYNSDALKRTLEFIEDNCVPAENINSKSLSGTFSHTDAQNAFLLGYLNERANPETAMLMEGTWWENEARSFFISLENSGENGRGYGQRDYRFMLFPTFDGQVNDKSCLTDIDCGSVAIAKLSDSAADKAKTAATKDFLAFTLKEENLRKFTVRTGVVRMYDYELTESDKANMTPFARCVYDIYRDSEHVQIIRGALEFNAEFYNYGYYFNWYNNTRNLAYGSMISCMNDAVKDSKTSSGTESMLKKYSSLYSETSWAQLIQDMRNHGVNV